MTEQMRRVAPRRNGVLFRRKVKFTANPTQARVRFGLRLGCGFAPPCRSAVSLTGVRAMLPNR
jgi:hypothetical protein